MQPTKPARGEPHAIVDLLDVLLREGVVIQADVVLVVADIPLVGLDVRIAVAGMATMTEYGMFEEWDTRHRQAMGHGVADTPRRDEAGPDAPDPTGQPK